jgi:colanic acid/amylovoran biosynthesis glycosyltransferase
VAHLIEPYLFLTGSWIHTQLERNREFRHVVLCQRTENLDLFPHEPVHASLDAAPAPLRAWRRFEVRLSRSYPLEPYRRWTVEEGAILLHAHFGWEACRALRLRKKTGLPLATSFYGLDASREVHRPHWRARYRELFRVGERFFVEGSHMAGRVAEAGAPRERIRVVPLGIDLARIPFRPRRLAPGESPRILFSGSFREKKGAADAVAAFARVAPAIPGARLVLLGDGERRREVEQAIAAGGCASAVDLRGYVGYGEYLAELGRAHILIAPSRTSADGDTEGGAPVTVIEAQAAGLPVVSTTHCDIPEVTVPGASALLSPEKDTAALAENLRALLSAPESWGQRGEAGRRHVERRHDATKQAARMAAEYRDILEEARS